MICRVIKTKILGLTVMMIIRKNRKALHNQKRVPLKKKQQNLWKVLSDSKVSQLNKKRPNRKSRSLNVNKLDKEKSF